MASDTSPMTNTVTHTPGPWEVHEGNWRFSLDVTYRNSKGLRRILARITSPAAHRKADVRLIAAVPDLLAALQGVMRVVEESSGVYGYHLNGELADWDEFPEVFEAFAAIAKATGEA